MPLASSNKTGCKKSTLERSKMFEFYSRLSNQSGWDMSVSSKGCKFGHTELSIHFESFNDEYATVKEAQDANLLSQESKLTRVYL